MKRPSELFKVYRETTIFKALYSAMLELAGESVLPLGLIPKIVHKYDEVAFQTVLGSTSNIGFVGNIRTFRIIENHYLLAMKNVNFWKTPRNGPAWSLNVTNAHVVPKTRGVKICNVDTVKVWLYNPIGENNLILSADEKPSPYTVEVARKPKKKKLKITDLPKPVDKSKFNPLLHAASVMSREEASVRGEEDWRRPMPYNEKLARASTEEEFMRLGETQAGKVEVLKGRWRRGPKQWPHRCVEARNRGSIDVRTPSGLTITNRNYMCLFKTQDRDLAELAISAGGTLALMAHNIFVVEDRGVESSPTASSSTTVPGVSSTANIRVRPQLRDTVKEIRDGYRTRRRNKIETTTFDAANRYEVKPKPPPKKRVVTSSDSSEESGVSCNDDDVEFLYEGNSWGRFVAQEKPGPQSQTKKDDSSIDKYLASTTSEENYDFLDDLIKESKEKVPVTETVEDNIEDFLDKITANEEDLIEKDKFFEEPSAIEGDVSENLLLDNLSTPAATIPCGHDLLDSNSNLQHFNADNLLLTKGDDFTLDMFPADEDLCFD